MVYCPAGGETGIGAGAASALGFRFELEIGTGAAMMGTSGCSVAGEASSLMGLPDWPVGEVERGGPWMFGWGEGVTCGMLWSSQPVS